MKYRLTMEGILQHLHEENGRNIDHSDVVIITPVVDNLTDEDEALEEEKSKTCQDLLTKPSTTEDSTSKNSVETQKSSSCRKRRLYESQPNKEYKQP